MIDLANQYVVKINYERNEKLLETIFLYSPDSDIIKQIEKQYKETGFNEKVREIIENDETEITYIQMAHHQHEIRAFRSITSHYEIFYYMTKENELIITDHIINILSYIPVSERTVCLEGVCDVFLYQHNYGKETYIKGVFRLGCGEELSYKDCKLFVKISQLLELGKYDFLKYKDGAEVLEESLRAACVKMQKKESINTLSGGWILH